MKGLSDAQKGYLAGIIDGDGSIALCERYRGNLYTHIYPVLTVANSDFEIAKYCHEVTCVGGVWTSRKSAYQWQVSRQKDVEDVIIAIKDFLVGKKRQAELVLEFISYRRRRVEEWRKDSRNWCKRLPHDEHELAIYQQVKELNQPKKIDINIKIPVLAPRDWSKPMIERVCPVCGKKFLIPARRRRQAKFCSNACRLKVFSKIRRQEVV
jgi:hypothetical protein